MLTEWLVRRFVASPEEVGRPLVRKSYGVLEGWVSIAVNLLVFAVKLVPGILIGSIALVADAFHSLGDVLSSGVIIWGFKAAARPSDREHPFGHGRMENVATLVIGILLFVAAWEFGQNSVIRLYEPRPVRSSAVLIVVLALTMVAKEWLSRFARALAAKIHSSALEGDFVHHRSDVLATAAVIVSLLAGNLGWQWVDGVGGLVIAGFIAVAAYKLTSDSINPLIGEAPSPGVIEEIRRTAMSVPEVDEVHDLTVHTYGGVVAISLHIEITCDLDVNRAHDVAEAVESALNERFGGASVVHIDPVNRRHPLYQPVRQFLDQLLPAVPGANGFHDLRIVGSDEPCYVILDLEAETEQAQRVASRVRSEVASRFPTVAKVVVNLEPRYVY